jgi:hypothetical protein
MLFNRFTTPPTVLRRSDVEQIKSPRGVPDVPLTLSETAPPRPALIEFETIDADRSREFAAALERAAGRHR